MMSNGMNKVLATKGVVDGELYDYDRTKLGRDPQVVQPNQEVTGDPAPPIKTPNGQEIPARFVKMRVPNFMTNQTVYTAMSMGTQAVQNAEKGVVTIVFPNVTKGTDGKAVASLEQFSMLTFEGEDIHRLLRVANAIHSANLKMWEEQKDPKTAVGAAKRARTIKDNMERDIAAKVEGSGGGIVLATR
jgi:hypothetical protein